MNTTNENTVGQGGIHVALGGCPRNLWTPNNGVAKFDRVSFFFSHESDNVK